MNVLITGANRGIGLEFARQLAARGEDIVATCRDPDGAEALRALGTRVEPLDVTDGEQIAALRDSLGGQPIDMLINNAGVGVRSLPLGGLDYEQMAAFYATNSMAPLRLTEALLDNLRAGSRRTVVNMTSRMGSIGDNTSGGSYAYRASKAALNMINRSLAADLAGENFVCVVLHPGWVQTDMGGASARTTLPDSVAGLLRVIDGLEADSSGRFYDFSGEELPW